MPSDTTAAEQLLRQEKLVLSSITSQINMQTAQTVLGTTSEKQKKRLDILAFYVAKVGRELKVWGDDKYIIQEVIHKTLFGNKSA